MSHAPTQDHPTAPVEEGHFRLKVSADHLYIYLDGLRAPKNGGKPIPSGDVIKALRRAKVSHGINTARIDEIITALNQGQLPEAPATSSAEPANSPARLQHLCVAQGTLPQHGVDSSITWLLDEDQIKRGECVVVPGQALASVTPASNGTEGKDVFGKGVRCHAGRDNAPKPGDGITAEPLDNTQRYVSNRYGTVHLVDNQLRVDAPVNVSADQLQASMTLSPPSTPGVVLTADHIRATLKQLGVVSGIQDDAIATAVANLIAAAQTTPEFVVARGTAPQHGVDARVQWHVPQPHADTPPCYLKPGEAIATLTAATVGTDGVDVHGKKLPATPGIPVTLTTGQYVASAEQNGAVMFRSTVLGVLRVNGTELSVDPGLTISADRLDASLALCAKSHDGKAVTIDDVTTTLTACGITVAPDTALMQAALAGLPADGAPQPRSVARGVAPQEGKDMRLVLSHKDSVGLELAHGRVDLNEHDYPWNVVQGETVGFLLRGKPQQDGLSVTGTVIKAPVPHQFELELTAITQDERGKLVAGMDGVLVISGNHLSVVDLLVIPGDMNHTVGKVHSKHGVHVKGHVEPGLLLESQKDVVIDQNVENATVKAGGSITIKGGIRGHHSEIFTPGNLTVGFIENAAVFVNGDINVKSSIINSTVATNGALFAGSNKVRHAAVMGGELTARHLIEVIELGTPNYGRTLVRLGIPQEERRRLHQLMKEIEALEKELDDLGKLEHLCEHHPGAKCDAIMPRAALTRSALEEKLHTQKTALDELHNQLDASQHSQLVVHKKIYPGVIINISDHVLELHEEHGPGVFTLENTHVVFHPR